jgi:electron transfer flavoprotein alpha subunit
MVMKRRRDDAILVVAELLAGRILPVTYEVIAFARALGGGDGPSIGIVVPGGNVQAVARELADLTGLDVIALEGDGLDPYNAEAWTMALSALIQERNPRHICIPHTSRGCDFAPGLAGGIGASCITAVEGLREEAGCPSFTRSIFNGKVRMRVASAAEMTVLTILPGAFRAEGKSPPRPDKMRAEVEVLKVVERQQKTRALGMIPAGEQDLDLALADVIVSAGRGVGNEENLALIRQLAGLFSKSAIGCSRTVCDRGWLGYRHQIGLTGKTVSPKLYIACGISGAIQHLAGMRGSKCVVAINKDPGAAIFQVADVGIVEDLTTFIPLVIGLCRPPSHSSGEMRSTTGK